MQDIQGDVACRRLIAYFRDCLVADAGQREINDVMGRNERLQHFVECAPGQWPDPPDIRLEPRYADIVLGTLQVQRHERELVFGAGLVIAQSMGGNTRVRHIRAPLWLYEASVDQVEDGYRLRISAASRRPNPTVLEALGYDGELASMDDEAAMRLLHGVEQLPAKLESGAYPAWRRGQPARWAPVGVAWLGTRTRIAATVAAELEEMAADQAQVSRPVRQILGQLSPDDGVRVKRRAQPHALPVGLTAAQGRALANAASERLSVINGPPGTGKTYTLACQAVDRVIQGESVLLVCGNDHAADVVHRQIAELLGPAQRLLVRGGRGTYQQELVARLDDLLAEGAADPGGTSGGGGTLDVGTLQLELMEANFHRGCGLAESDLGVLGAEAGGLWGRARAALRRRRVLRSPLLMDAWQRLHEQRDRQRSVVRAHLESVSVSRQRALVDQRRAELAGLASALRARSSGAREGHFEALDWRFLCAAFPLWVVSAQALSRVLPLTSELFDLAIIDEATQCSLPLALPALQRARRAVVVGDPKQIRHYSFLSRAHQNALAVTHGVAGSAVSLDYRERSTLDYALENVAGPRAVVLLDEHFRSHPVLIGFSNREFYDGQLRILTRFDRREEPPFERVTCAVRLSGDVNLEEVDSLLDRLTALIEESASLPDAEAPRLGVMALFRSTAMRIESELLARYDLRTIARHALRVGTPYAFQGEERDVMLIASGLYPGRAAAAWNHLERPDVFNVAVTRARRRQILFLPEGTIESRDGSLLARYVRSMQDVPGDSSGDRGDVTFDRLCEEVAALLRGQGLDCRIGAPFAAEPLDLVVVEDTRVTAIDVIEGSAGSGVAWTPARYRQLERAGIQVLPISWGEWTYRQSEVIARLERHFQVGGAREAGSPTWLPATLVLRGRLVALDSSDLLQLYDGLSQAAIAVGHWIERRFDAGELAYVRYQQSLDRLHRAACIELEGAAEILESVRDLGFEDESRVLAQEIDRRMEGCRQAVETLRQLSGQLAILRPGNDDLESALDDIRVMTDRVPRYAGGSVVRLD